MLLLLVSTAGACSKPDPPKLTPERVTLSGVSDDGVDLQVELSALNPNRVDLSAQSLTVKLSCDGREAGSTTMDHPVSLPAGQTTKLDVPLHVKWAAASTLPSLAATGRDVPYAVDGTVGLGGDLVHVDVPFHMTGTVSKDDLLRAAVRSLPQIPGMPGLKFQ
jgi:LEA14-like dessication related protein